MTALALALCASASSASWSAADPGPADRGRPPNQAPPSALEATPKPTPLPPVLTKGARGMWVWTTTTILGNKAERNRFLNEASASGATMVFLYLTAEQVAPNQAALRSLVGKLSSLGVASYGMDGWRGYFSDASGPSGLYASVDALVSYNAAVAANERFVGFMTDMEPQDGQGIGLDLFHNNVPESALTPEQRADRDRIMLDWLEIHATLQTRLHAAGLRLAASLPSWTDDYYGQPVLATYDGRTDDVTHFLMGLVDDYCVMSYNTSPSNIASRVVTKLAYADTLAAPPRVFGGVETHNGVGAGVSYGDTPPKNTKRAVVADLDAVFGLLDRHPTFAGMNVHDWVGWQALSPASDDTRAPHRPARKRPPHASGWCY